MSVSHQTHLVKATQQSRFKEWEIVEAMAGSVLGKGCKVNLQSSKHKEIFERGCYIQFTPKVLYGNYLFKNDRCKNRHIF